MTECNQYYWLHSVLSNNKAYHRRLLHRPAENTYSWLSMLFSSWITCNCFLTCCSHVLTGPYWLKAHKGDLHRQDQANDVEGAVGWRDKSTS